MEVPAEYGALRFWRNTEELESHWAEARRYEPNMSEDDRTRLYSGWKKAVTKSFDWVE